MYIRKHLYICLLPHMYTLNVYLYIYIAIECILYAYLLVVFCIKVTRYLTPTSNTCGFIIYIYIIKLAK